MWGGSLLRRVLQFAVHLAKRVTSGLPTNRAQAGKFGQFPSEPEFFLGLLQLRVFRLSSNEDGDVGVGVFPEREEILIGSTRFDVVARQGIGPAQLKMRSGYPVKCRHIRMSPHPHRVEVGKQHAVPIGERYRLCEMSCR